MNVIKQPMETLSGQAGNNHVRRSDQLALARAFADFARQHPDWAAAFFDEHFLGRHTALLLNRTGPVSRASMAFELAMEWGRQFQWQDQKRFQRLVNEASAVALDFLLALEHEIGGRQVTLSFGMRGA